MSAFVYVASNEPGVVKIGKTSDLEKRLNQLNNSSVRNHFSYRCTVEVENKKSAHILESILHYTFAGERCSKDREFFKIPLDDIVVVLRFLKTIAFCKIVKILIEDTPCVPYKQKQDLARAA